MILSAQSIKARKGMVEPFLLRSTSFGMTHGLSGCGFDCRISETMVLEPGGFTLASTIERFDIPLDVMGVVHDKSTWVRRGLSVFNTVLECGWRGHLTIELVNNAKIKLNFERGMPICQVIFHQLDQPTELPYGKGKYQDQPARPIEAILREEPELEMATAADLPSWITGKK